MKKWRPDWIYKGINNNPDSWGMCCSREMAEECAEEWFDNGGWKEYIAEVFAEKVDKFLTFLCYVIASYIGWCFFIYALYSLGVSNQTYTLIRYASIVAFVLYNIRYRRNYRIWDTVGKYPYDKLIKQRFFAKLALAAIIAVIICNNIEVFDKNYVPESNGKSCSITVCEIKE